MTCMGKQMLLRVLLILGLLFITGCRKDDFNLLLDDDEAIERILGKADPKCGPIALNYVCATYGVESTVEELARLADTDQAGTTMHKLAEAAGAKGLKTIGLQLSFKRLKRIPKPVIAFVGRDHYVVVKSITGRAINAISNGKEIQIKKSDFLRIWKGDVLEVRPEDGIALSL